MKNMYVFILHDNTADFLEYAQLIKCFMQQISALVLARLLLLLSSLKSESLNPVALRANQAATSGRHFSKNWFLLSCSLVTLCSPFLKV